MRRELIKGAAATLVAALALASVSEAVAARKPTKQQLAVIEHRQAQMKQLGGAMKALAGFAQGQHADVAQVRAAAATVSRSGASMPHLFPAGTQVGAGDSNTHASLWKERDAFAQRVAQFQKAARDMDVAAATGQRAQVGAALRGVGASCKACHDEWQVKD